MQAFRSRQADPVSFPQRAELGPSRRRVVVQRLPHAANGMRIDEALGPSSLVLPRDLAVSAGRLLDQQLWCWGRDVVRPEGNLLVDYGFQRLVPDGRVAQATCYSARHPVGTCAALWSWGLFFGSASEGGLFLRRASIAPYLTADATLPHPHWPVGIVPRHQPPRTAEEAFVALRLLVRVARWIANYEEWIRRILGPDHRAACLREWPRVTGDADALAALWSNAADEIERRAVVADDMALHDERDSAAILPASL